MTPAKDPDIELAEQVREYREDPLGFVRDCWPWGEGNLSHATGPDKNQTQFLDDLGRQIRARKFNGKDPVSPIRMAISSAHGTGKSTLGAWLAWFILSTRPMSKGTVTAGTYDQLERVTWAEIMHWGRMCCTAHWFDIQASGIYAKDPRLAESWKLTPKTAAAERAQTFAGQHAADSTSWYLFDEASEIADKVWETAYGGITDGEPMFFCWGQMIRNSGEFFNVTFGDSSASGRWDSRVWSGLNSNFTNKDYIEEIRQDWGEESDYWRIRVLGLPPRASELQFIGQALIDGARKRDHTPLADEPLVWGFDAANGGQARFCLWARRGLDAATIPPIFMPGDTPRDVVVGKILEVMNDRRPGMRPAALFGDQAFGAVILQRVRDMGYTNVFEVNFGDTSHDKHYLNRRAEMWGRMKEWLSLGSIPDDPKIYQPFMDPGFGHRNGRLVLESKSDMAKRGVKALSADTPIPVPGGWKKMGELLVGDQVFDENGIPTKIVRATDIVSDSKCYRLEFSNGDSIIADSGHLWKTFQRHSGGSFGDSTRGKRRSEWKRRPFVGIRTTEEICTSMRNGNSGWNHRVSVTKPLQCESEMLTIDPYILGVWLGDGDSDAPRITIGFNDEELLTHLRDCGADIGSISPHATSKAWRVSLGPDARYKAAHDGSLRSRLLSNGVLNNKHIPVRYLRSSKEQRLELLRGLLDTDGSIEPIRGRISIASSIPSLGLNLLELIRSLGYKPSVSKMVPRVGKPYSVIQFMAYNDVFVFKLKRKASRQISKKSRVPMCGHYGIVKCEVVESVPVRCITVDAPSGMFLAGESMIPTHNSPDGPDSLATTFSQNIVAQPIHKPTPPAARPHSRYSYMG